MSKIKTLLFLALAFMDIARSAGVYHVLKPGGTFLTSSTLWTCSTNKNIIGNSACNPGLFVLDRGQGVKIELFGKADGAAIESGQDLIFEPIDQEFLSNVFQRDNFLSFTFSSALDFKTPIFSLAYSPFYLLADIYINNPSFAQASVNIINQSTLSLTSGVDLSPLLKDKEKILTVGARVFRYDQNYSQSQFNLLELGFKQPADLITSQDRDGIAGDVGAFLQLSPSWWIPDFSFQIKNLGDDVPVNPSLLNSPTALENFLLLETYSRLGIGKNIETPFGEFHLGTDLPFDGVLNELYADYISGSVTYTLGIFSVVGAISKYHQSTGLYFQSDIASVGILYSFERDLGRFEEFSDKAAYLNLEIFL